MSINFNLILFCIVVLSLSALAAPTDNNYYVENPYENPDFNQFTATLNFTIEPEPFPPKCVPFDEPRNNTLKFLEENRGNKYLQIEDSCQKGIIPEQYQELDLEYSLDTKEIHYIKISVRNEKRWEVPKYVLSEKYQRTLMKNINETALGRYFRYTHEPVALILRNPRTREEFLSIGRTTLVYRNDYIAFDYEFTNDLISGFGERSHPFKLTPGVYTSFANDTGLGAITDDGTGGKNLYGQQPFIFHRTRKGTYVGILFLNSNAQDIVVSAPNKWNNTYVEHRTIGGIVELYAWTRDSPLEVIRTYHELIGTPALPPFWALGWHQCKYGYKDGEEWIGVVAKYKENNIPLDTMWLDIDYMQKYYDFTISSEKFTNLPKYIQQIHDDGLQVVPILDIGIPTDPTDKFYKLGMDLNVFIMSNYTDKPLINTVWPGKTHFPDFTHPNAKKYWEEGLSDFKKIFNYDGLWLDMNEPGMINSDPVGEQDANIDPAKNMYANLYYYPGNNNIHLERHTISLNAKLHGDPQINTIYNSKPLNPFNQNKITSEYIRNTINRRSFVLSRSNFVGMGRYSNHWLGDNFSTWQSMKESIPGIFNFQMFGFNLAGVDICGFIFDTNDKLCARWHTLGAFYPFARNHNNLGSVDQHPYNVGPLTLASTLRALNIRYALLRYLYSEAFLSSKYGGVVFQPVLFQFPQDEEATKHLDEQAMIGPSLMLVPVLKEDEDDFDAFIPNSNWNNLIKEGELNFEPRFNFNPSSKTGKMAKLGGKYTDLNLFFRGGRILPMQFNNNKVRRSKELRNLKTSIIVNPDQNGEAEGTVVFDNDEVHTLENGNYVEVNVRLHKQLLSFNTINRFIEYSNNDIFLDEIKILRVASTTELYQVTIKDRFFEPITGFTVDLDKTGGILTISFANNVRLDDITFVYLTSKESKMATQ